MKETIVIACNCDSLREFIRVMLPAGAYDTRFCGNEPDLLVNLDRAERRVLIVEESFAKQGTVELVKSVMKKYSRLRVAVCSIRELSAKTVSRYFAAGAESYIDLRRAGAKVKGYFRKVVDGEQLVPPEVMKRMEEEAQYDGPTTLTPKERIIIKHCLAGQSNEEIAAQLFISEKTVKTHKTHIIQKAGGRHYVDLLKLAIRQRIISGEELVEIIDAD
jgi:DNA-binding NarL/FixJ family response regulator